MTLHTCGSPEVGHDFYCTKLISCPFLSIITPICPRLSIKTLVQLLPNLIKVYVVVAYATESIVMKGKRTKAWQDRILWIFLCCVFCPYIGKQVFYVVWLRVWSMDYGRGRQPFVVVGPKNEKITSLFCWGSSFPIFLPFVPKFFDLFFLLLRI